MLTKVAPTGMNSWSVNASGYSSYGTRTLRTEVYSNEIANIVDTDDNTRQYSWISGLSENTVYSFSNYYRKISGTPTFRYQLSWYTDATALISANWVQTANLGIADVSGWQRAMCTITTPANTDKMIWWLQDGADYTGYTHEFEIKRPMMETNSHVTKFVNGSRSATDGWKDLSGNGNHADLTSLTYSATNIRNTPNNDFSFDGSGDYITVDGHSSINFGSGEFTYEVWYKTDASSESGLICKYGSGDIWFATNGSALRCGIRDSSNNELNFYPGLSGVTCNDDEWHHSAMARSGQYVYVYIDGQYSSTGDNSSVGSTDSGGNTYIGVLTPGAWEFDGEIAIARIYRKALSAAEVSQNYNAQRGRFGV